MDSEQASAFSQKLVTQVSRALRGKTDAVTLCVVALLARGHVLIEDVPGVGKTTLARALAASLGLVFRRVQFTSDLMPADVLGGNIFDRASGEFVFRPGPVFTQVLLADEINRTTPRTQSALLEAMGERQVSIDGETRTLDAPFFVLATQNPQDFFGTYPLPESQLDRFLLRLHLGYPEPAVEREVLSARSRGADPTESMEPLVSSEEVLAAQAAVDDVKVADPVLDYLHEVVLATRSHSLLQVGASTRAALAFERAIRAHALVDGRDFALPDDVKALAVPVLAHRVRARAEVEGETSSHAERILREILESLSIPV